MLKVAVFGFCLFGINTYIVYDETSRDCAVIDPGMIDDEERDALAGFIDKNGLRVTHLINTHLHIDHCIGNEWVEQKYGVRAEAHPDDAMLGENLPAQAASFGIPGRHAGVKAAHELHDGDVIRIGEGELEVIHVPGHSPGGIALYDRQDGWLICGDILFEGGIGRWDLPGGDHDSLVDGIRRKLLTLPERTAVYPGHGGSTTIGREKISNPYL